MKTKLTAIAMLALITLAPMAQAETILLEAGKLVTISPKNKIDSDDYKIGGTVEFVVPTAVKQNGVTLIKANELVTGEFIELENNSPFGHPAKVLIGNFKTKSIDNQEISLRGLIEEKGKSRYWANIGYIGIFILPLLPIIFVKGDDVILQSNKTFNLFTLEDVKIAT